MAALSQIRGSQRVTDQNPENRYEALEKYGRDLTELARAGQARSGDRPRRRDPAGDPGSEPAHEEQPVLIGEPGVGKTAIAEGSPSGSCAAMCPRAEGQARRFASISVR